MDREFLEDYEQKERNEYDKLMKKIFEEKISFRKDRFPPDERFVKLQKPVALGSHGCVHVSRLWTQLPFCGSLIILLPPYPRSEFERVMFKVSEIPDIIDFIKETGKLQVAFTTDELHAYEGLDYLDPFFKELNPPIYFTVPLSIFANEKETDKAAATFYTLGKTRYLDFLRKLMQPFGPFAYSIALEKAVGVYVSLKIGQYANPLVEAFENLMIDDPRKASWLLEICSKFVAPRINDMRFDTRNFTFEEIRTSQFLPLVYQPKEIRFPCEIGKLLLKKLTYAPTDFRACNQLIDHYDAYDLRKVAESLNDSIATNNPDIVNKSAEELSEILDNVWKDPTIPRRVKGLKIGIPLSIAAIGSVWAGPIGAAAGFFAGLGFNVLSKFIDTETEELSEKLSKLRTKSYQANVYDFKKKYKAKIRHP